MFRWALSENGVRSAASTLFLRRSLTTQPTTADCEFMGDWLAIGGGGFLGALLRYRLYLAFPRRPFPWGILVANLLGCFAMGVLMALIAERAMFSDRTRHFLLVGVLGALTTFSSFGYDTFDVARQGAWNMAALNVCANVVGGVLAVAAGAAVARAFA